MTEATDELAEVKRLLVRVRTTMSNDDTSRPDTVERDRHVERFYVMQAASDTIARLEADLAAARKERDEREGHLLGFGARARKVTAEYIVAISRAERAEAALAEAVAALEPFAKEGDGWDNRLDDYFPEIEKPYTEAVGDVGATEFNVGDLCRAAAIVAKHRKDQADD